MAPAALAAACGARVVVEPRRGLRCGVLRRAGGGSERDRLLHGLRRLAGPGRAARVVASPVASGAADLCLGARRAAVPGGAWPWHARVANRVLAFELRRRCGVVVTDLGPMRAARREALLSLELQDRGFGWPLEMVLRAADAGWRVGEVPVSATTARRRAARRSAAARSAPARGPRHGGPARGPRRLGVTVGDHAPARAWTAIGREHRIARERGSIPDLVTLLGTAALLAAVLTAAWLAVARPGVHAGSSSRRASHPGWIAGPLRGFGGTLSRRRTRRRADRPDTSPTGLALACARRDLVARRPRRDRPRQPRLHARPRRCSPPTFSATSPMPASSSATG